MCGSLRPSGVIDEFLPLYDMAARYQTVIHAGPDVIYEKVRSLDFARSWIIRQLFRLRGLPCRNVTIERLQEMRFAVLLEDPPREMILGLIGRFWTLSGELRETSADHFPTFAEPGYAKAVWNFQLTEQSNGLVTLSTETRVLCTDETSRRRFLRYWMVVGPFSGLIRKEALRLVKQECEHGPQR